MESSAAKPTAYSGGCLCGQVRYRAEGEPLAVSVCHCRNCQQNTGSAFSVNAVFAEENVALSGSLSIYEDRGDSGAPVLRYFCPTCGTPIRSAAARTSGFFVIKAGTLDDPGRLSPTDAIYCKSEIRAWTAPRRRHEGLP